MRNVSALLMVLLLAGGAFSQSKHQKMPKAVLFQGICGTVLAKEGNLMPSPDAPRKNPNGIPAEREVLIYPLLNISQVDQGEGGFINSTRAVQPVKTVKSDKAGKFCVSLPVGRYSVVVREPKGLYANLFDSQNNISPVKVEKGKKAIINVEITHQAVF